MEMQAEAEHRKRLFCFCSVGLFLAILESQKEVSEVLLPSLMQLGLTNLLASLLASEMTKLSGEKIPERYSVLDVILRAIEALSTVDCLSQEICCNKELFQLVCDLVKLPDKAEVFNSCATAAVLIANIMSDVPDFASDISHDLTFLQGLLDIFPLVSDDMEAQNALWSVTARLLVRVKENEMDLSYLYQYVLVLASKPQLQRIISILNKWTASKECHELDEVMEEHSTVDVNVGKMGSHDMLEKWQDLEGDVTKISRKQNPEEEIGKQYLRSTRSTRKSS